MKAVGYIDPKPISDPAALLELDCKEPAMLDSDILVKVRAVSVNPVDYKVRSSQRGTPEKPVILGWDAAGTVVKLGRSVSGFKVGDDVYYAGDRMRDGTNAELHAIDFRLVGRKPKNLPFSEAAALPLTALTAYEALFEKMKVPTEEKSAVLIIGGAGGVGSMAVQFLRALTPATIYATYNRPESLQQLRDLRVDFPVSRNTSLIEQRQQRTIPEFDFIFSTTHTADHAEALPEIIKPFGSICLIDDPAIFDIVPLKRKSVSVHWELMFTKSLFNQHIESQGQILNKVTALIESGKIRSTANTMFKGLTAKNFIEAHQKLESGQTVGKIVIEF